MFVPCTPVECSSSVVKCRTRNREGPGSKPPFVTVSKIGHLCSLHNVPVHSEHLAIDSGGNVSE